MFKNPVEDAPWCLWVFLHLALYLALDLGTLAVLVAAGGTGAPEVFGGALVTFVWTLPLHVAMLVVAVVQLMVLDVVSADLGRLAFRLTALGVFVVPAFGYAALIADPGYGDALRFVLPMHIAMGLLVAHRNYRYANSIGPWS
ncbi:hypothetical protein [Dactylosporangium sp. CA-139066]|uniref:hypothetical protein n=1 Tax=Dactylosporangium sp. CA-139066 TaxID=3239930 RepID=UPI003D8C33B4